MISGIEQLYSSAYPFLQKLAAEIEADIRSHLAEYERIDRISARAKGIASFVGKAKSVNRDGSTKYRDPSHDIQDQIGARIVTYYLDDVEQIDDLIRKYYRKIEDISKEPPSEKEFAYEAKHYILFIPADIAIHYSKVPNIPKVFELQLKTLFQHAWAQAEHDLNYKTDFSIDPHDRKLIYFSAAQAWGADRAFNDFHRKYK